jgi:hypothetical protein
LSVFYISINSRNMYCYIIDCCGFLYVVGHPIVFMFMRAISKQILFSTSPTFQRSFPLFLQLFLYWPVSTLHWKVLLKSALCWVTQLRIIFSVLILLRLETFLPLIRFIRSLFLPDLGELRLTLGLLIVVLCRLDCIF